MDDIRETYHKRFWKRFFKDATPWARDNILWGVLFLVVPPLIIYARDRHAPVDWVPIRATLILYALAFAIYALVHLCRVPKKLDQERDAREAVLKATIKERDQTIQQQSETILASSEKPRYTPAEQHDYDKAKKALQQFGQKAVTALGHLRTQGPLVFGTFDPLLPSGLNRDDAMWAYNACAGEGLVSREMNSPKQGDIAFAIAPKVERVLDDLLYDESL